MNRLRRSLPLWGPRLLLLGLAAVLVLGACGTANLLREDAARQPLVLRHHVQRSKLLFMTVFQDTLSTDLVYRGQVLLPTAAECPTRLPDSLAAGNLPQRLRVRHVRPLAGPEPRWVFELTCPDGQTRALYLLRLPPGGPSFHRIGAWHGWLSPNLAEHVRLPDSLSYFDDTESGGTLFDWRRLTGTPVVLRNLDALRWLPPGPNVYYSLSPDQQTLARVYRETLPAAPVAPGTTPAQATPSRVRLTIDTYDFAPRSTRRLLLNGLQLPPIKLPRLLEWQQANGRWELLPRP